jgi:hypothetical protein
MAAWTKEELDYLHGNLEKTNQEIADHLERTVSSVREKKSELGLKKKMENVIGKRFGSLVILELYSLGKEGKQNNTYAKCVCDCDNHHRAQLSEIKRGNVKTCGCIFPTKVGDKFHRLTILKKYIKFEGGQNKTYLECECECGNIVNARLTAVKTGTTKSCGCWKKEQASIRLTEQNYKHGLGDMKHRLYRVWHAMKNRCNNENVPHYNIYGGRGIKVCEEWYNYECFYKWAMENGYQDKLSIDRINPDGHYEPSNCRWATSKEQAMNTRAANRITRTTLTAFGETKGLREWIEDERCVISSVTTLCYRLGSGWSPEKAITKPSERAKDKKKGVT